MADSTPKSYHTDPQLYLYTSLTSGSSQIVTATSRLQTILNANKIPFQALDVATDEKARMLWGRRAGKRKMPGLVRMGMILGDLEQVEEWNEYGEIKENLSFAPATASVSTPTPSAASTPLKAPSQQYMSTVQASSPSAPSAIYTGNKAPPPAPSLDQIPASAISPSETNAAPSLTAALRQAGFEAAKKATDAKTKARNDILSASTTTTASDSPKTSVTPETLQKMDQSGPTGMPPPSGMTGTEEAKKPESGATSLEGKADTVPTAGSHEQAGTDIPTARTAEAHANTSIADTSIAVDEVGEDEVLEGQGQAEPVSKIELLDNPSKDDEKASSEDVPSAKQIEEQAHNAMVVDEIGSVHLANGEQIGSPPPPSISSTATPIDDSPASSATGDARPPMPAVSESPAEVAKAAAAVAAHGATELVEPSSVAADPEDDKAADETAPVVPLEVKGTPARAAETGSLAKPISRAGSVANPPDTSTEGHDDDIVELPTTVGSETAEKVERVEGMHEGQALPGSRTQEQGAAEGEKVGESVAD